MIKIIDTSEVKDFTVFARRDEKKNEEIEKIVEDIIENVKENGDKALFEYCEKFDKCRLQSLLVSEDEINEAFNSTDDYFIETLKQAKENIAAFHEKQLRNNFVVTKDDGIILGQKITPVEKAGLYVPGGTAAYPSTVLMDAVPAQIAGVKEIVMVTPPSADGKINPAILTAAKIAGVTKIFKVGGAQAIAALAYGTETIPKVDKIVGPGNIFVATAKKQVYGKVSIDMIAGPSEILIIAEPSCEPENVAADLLSQAEHDKMASAVLITTDKEFAKRVAEETERQIKLLPRAEIAEASIENNGKIFIVDSIKKAVELSNEIAPEHLEVCVDNPFELLPDIKNAGSIFLGKNVPEALGDYFAGPNHTLPTSGTAKFSSPLSVDDFIKKSSFIYYSHDALEKSHERIEDFANREGLQAHGKSVSIRFNKF
ncbi:MAG: histidinol dehydrogenase [Clostridiales bacterium]|nr:histidinol dehydrogenase [Clostridiales bacterium]